MTTNEAADKMGHAATGVFFVCNIALACGYYEYYKNYKKGR
jgi:hypothetical protein